MLPWRAQPDVERDVERLESGPSRQAYSAMSYTLVVAALTVCFFAANVTNRFIIEHSGRIFPLINNWLIRSVDPMYDFAGKDIPRFSAGSLREGAFFWALILLGWRLRTYIRNLIGDMGNKSLWSKTLISIAISNLLFFSIAPSAHGLIYAKISISPFMQEPNIWYRRILPMEVAETLHLSGILYIALFWMIVAFVFYIADLYLIRKGVDLSIAERTAIYTTGMFATAIGWPAEPEILVLGLTLLAMLDFEQTGQSGPIQLACSGLALLTHESAALLAFGVLGLFMFGRRFIVGYLLLLGLYVFSWLLEFGFDPASAARIHTVIGGQDAFQTFREHIPQAILSVFTTFKLLLVVAVAAVVMLARRGDPRRAALIVCAIIGGFALMIFASDFTRMAAFGTFGVLVALPVILPDLSPRRRGGLAAANLIIPTIVIQGHSGIWTFSGVYGIVLRRVFGLH